jgi:hypothetical protein
MTKAKGRHRRESRLPEISGRPEQRSSTDENDQYEETDWVSYHIYLSDQDRIVVRQVLGLYKQVVDFAIIQQISVDGKWHDVVRYDCSHGRVHLHLFKHGRVESMTEEICSLDRIEEGYARAEAVVFDEWAENRRRYFNVSRGK